MSGTNQLLISANNQNGISNGFMSLVGGGRWDSASTSTNNQIKLKQGATFSNMSVVFTGGISNGTAHFGINGSAGNQVAVGNSGRVTDLTDVDTCATGNLVDYIYTTGFATATMFSVQMNTTGAYTQQGSGPGGGNADFNFQTTKTYTSEMGGGGSVGAVTSVGLAAQQLVEVGGTLSHFFINISTATSGTGTVHPNINGTDGNSTCVAGSGVTGQVIDLTNVDTLTATNLLCTSIISTNASGGIHSWGYSFVAGTGAGMDATSSISGSTSPGSFPTYFAFGGTLANNLTQVNTQAYCPYGLTASKLRITSSGTTTTGTMVFQNGGVTGNGTVTWTGTGVTAVDLTHHDTVLATNLIGGAMPSGTSANISSVGITLDDGSLSSHPNFMAWTSA